MTLLYPYKNHTNFLFLRPHRPQLFHSASPVSPSTGPVQSLSEFLVGPITHWLSEIHLTPRSTSVFLVNRPLIFSSIFTVIGPDVLITSSTFFYYDNTYIKLKFLQYKRLLNIPRHSLSLLRFYQGPEPGLFHFFFLNSKWLYIHRYIIRQRI